MGGGNSAVETALDLHRNGVRVRMVHFADVFDRGVKPWFGPTSTTGSPTARSPCTGAPE